MKTLVICCIFSLFMVHFSQTAPIDPEDEVELVPAVRTEEAEEDYDDEGFIPIFVIRRTEGSPFLGSFPFGDNEFPFNFFGGSEERIDIDDGQETIKDEIIPDIPIIPDISSFFDDQSSTEGGQADLCGFICNIMKQFDDKLSEIEANIKSIKNDQLIPDVNNSTYSEKVLPDGTIVKVNKTIISDTSDDGNSYFFHSTSFHNVEQPDIKPDTEEEGGDEITEKTDEKFDEFPVTMDYEEIPFLDDSLNEVPEDNVGIDEGLA